MIGVNKNFPYDVHSVWNRNQLGALSLTDPLTLGLYAVLAYFGYQYFMKGKLSL